VGTRQGDPISPTTFISYLERLMEDGKSTGSGVSVHGYMLNNLAFADDIDMIEETNDALQTSVEQIHKAGEETGLKINKGKTKTLVFGQQQIDKELKVDGETIENVTEFEYLGSLITWDNDCSAKIKRRIAKATGAMAGFNKVWRSKDISVETKVEIIRTCIFSILLYASEAWTIKKADKDRLLAFEMKCFRRILHIRWEQKITNTEVRRRVKAQENIFQRFMRRKLNLFGHICRMDSKRLLKTVVFGMIDGKNRRGRPNREWLDDIVDWCAKDIHEVLDDTADRQTWTKCVETAVNTNGH
jgi:hypothetical protein